MKENMYRSPSASEMQAMMAKNMPEHFVSRDSDKRGFGVVFGIVIGCAVLGLLVGHVGLMLIYSTSFVDTLGVVTRQWYALVVSMSIITGLIVHKINNKHKEDFARLYRKIDRLEKKLDEMGVRLEARD